MLHHLHAEVVHEALLLLHGDLLVGQRRERGRAPVHHAFAAVDQALLVQVHEHLLHAPGILRIHREAGAGPVAGGAERAQLLEDDAAVGLLPFPDLGHQRLAAEVVAVLDLAGLFEGLLDHVLGGDARVVGARQPEDFLAVHACLAGEDVLDGVVQDMAHGQHPGDVRGRDDDGIRGPGRRHAGRIGREAALLFPELVPLGLDGLRLVGLGNLAHFGPANLPEPRESRQQVAAMGPAATIGPTRPDTPHLAPKRAPEWHILDPQECRIGDRRPVRRAPSQNQGRKPRRQNLRSPERTVAALYGRRSGQRIRSARCT